MSDQLAMAVAPESLPATVDAESLIAKAIEHNVPIETLERLLALRDKLKAEQARQAFFAALSAFQADCPIITKGKSADIGGKYAYRYAPLDQIVRQVSPILAKHGLAYTFDTELDDAAMVCVCTVHHVAGHQETSRFRVPIDKTARMNDAQKEASANTYGNRYAFRNALGILTADEDDDGGSLDGKAKVDFGAPPRKSAPPPSEPGDIPDDAMSDNKIKAVRSKIHAQLKAHGRDDAATMALVESRLDELAAHDGRTKWQHASWRDFPAVLDSVEAVVATLPPKETR